MKNLIYLKSIALICFIYIIISCSGSSTKNTSEKEHDDEEQTVSLTEQQVEAISLKLGEIKEMNLSKFIVTNGLITVPPDQRLDISAIIGANISDIKVLEGQKVKKGDVIAIIEHPDLIDIQVEYITALNNLSFLEKEYNRLKTLADNNIASGKNFQQAQADYYSANTLFHGLKSKLEMIGINVDKLESGKAQRYIPIISPIKGVVNRVSVNIGKYVEPQSQMFEIINTDHLHADFAVYEKDLGKVKIADKLIITLNDEGGKEYTGEVISIGKRFDATTRAITIQVELTNSFADLVPGVFVKGRIIIDEQKLNAVPKDALVTEGDKSYVFIVDKDENNDAHENNTKTTNKSLKLKMIEVVKGIEDRGYIEIKPLVKIDKNTHIALNGAYYLFAEIKKTETEHSH